MGDDQLPNPGDLIGVRYRIESLLGQGGMGAVYAAVNQATGRAVAIKWLLPGAARSKESLARFLAEARATAKIEHPNVIQILDVGQDGEAPFLVMERLRGESLADRLERGALSVEETLAVMIDSCRGVHEAHREGIIHRDLKPDNIFLCRGKDGSERPPKVLDFGISKLYDDEGGGGASGAPMTQTGIAMGTPWYMSPEQINAAGKPDARYDVYAMGVVLYECLAGKPPYDAAGLFELVQQIAAGQAPPLRTRAPQVPADLEQIVARAMSAHRDYRHPSMKELIADLEAVQARMRSGTPAPIPQTAAGYGGMTPPPMSAPGAYTPPAGMYGTPAASAYGTPPPSTAALATGSGAAYHPQSGPQMYAPPPKSGGGSGLAIGLAVGLIAVLFLAVLGVGGAIYAFSGDDDSGGGGGGGGGGGNPITNLGGGGGVLGGGNDNPRDPDIDVTFSGTCTPRFNARRMVTGGGGNVNVMSSNMAGLTGAIYMGFPNGTGTVQLSTQQRMDTQTVINVMVGQAIWTNMTMDVVAVRAGRIPDPVSGTVTVREFDSELARADVTFTNVNLQSVRDGSICTLNGRLQTRGTTYGM